jgi:1,4-alpha-glucan branching enzyme
MPISNENIDTRTPMGAQLATGGATFRVWAPAATAVHLRLSNPAASATATPWTPGPDNLLIPDGLGYWAGFVPGVTDGTRYLFHVVGAAGAGLKRDPRGRELVPEWPDSECLVRDPNAYPWHDQSYRPPAFNDLVIYQFHVGTYSANGPDGRDHRTDRSGTFLDVVDRIPHLAALGVNAIEPLPIDEFPTHFSMGYNGTDINSPEMEYAVAPDDLDPFLERVNELLAARGRTPLERKHLESQINQLEAMVDLCHVYGIAVILDVVYNHAGGGFDPQSLYFFDFQVNHSNNDSLYFTDQGWAGGLVPAYWKDEVRQFLIDNARLFLGEYHVDGLRYDEVTVIDQFGGWRFCQDLTGTLHYLFPATIHIAEYWRDDQTWVLRPPDQGGAGFDAVWHTGIRESVRAAVGQAAWGREAAVDLDAVAAALQTPAGFSATWRGVQHLENHDVVYAGHDDRKPRVAALGDPSDHRSWYARSRARVATGLLMTAPGIPMLFMGQEFLEDKPWSDSPNPLTLIWWDGLETDRVMRDFLAFSRDLVRLRRRQPALRGEATNVFHVHNGNRVIAFHRWLPGAGRDVVVVASLAETTYDGYQLGFPRGGLWIEVFNADYYDTMPNPDVKGNGGHVVADGPPLHGLPTSAPVVIPAGGLVVFALDRGD